MFFPDDKVPMYMTIRLQSRSSEMQLQKTISSQLLVQVFISCKTRKKWAVTWVFIPSLLNKEQYPYSFHHFFSISFNQFLPGSTVNAAHPLPIFIKEGKWLTYQPKWIVSTAGQSCHLLIKKIQEDSQATNRSPCVHPALMYTHVSEPN